MPLRVPEFADEGTGSVHLIFGVEHLPWRSKRTAKGADQQVELANDSEVPKRGGIADGGIKPTR